MSVYGIISEFNPFHNGHLKHINYIKEQINPDCIAIIMSGNFNQRGEMAIFDKYTRATHAIKAGADIVFELPTVFATAPAEIFAKGGIKLANCFLGNNVICFGTESAEKDKLLATAKALLDESKEFKKLISKLYLEVYRQDEQFRKDIKKSAKYKLVHSIGNPDPKDTVLTESEFIEQLVNLQKL